MTPLEIKGRVRHIYKLALRWMIYAILRPIIECFRLVPPRVAAAVGEGVGALAGLFMWRERRRAEANLVRAFPDLSTTARQRIVRAHFRHLGRSLGEFLSLTRRDPAQLKAMVRVEGLEHLESARAAGRGAVVLTAHLGSWEVAAAAIGLRVPNLAVVARDLYDPRLSRLSERLRAHFNVRTFDTHDTRSMFRHLKRGGVLGVLVDQASRRVLNVPVGFFGRPVDTPVGPVNLAARAGSALLTGFIMQTGSGYRLILEELAGHANGTPPARQLERYNRRLEHWVREHPEQWVWMHNRWSRKVLAPALLLGAVLAVIAGCQSSSPGAKRATAKFRRGPDVVMYGVKVTQVVNGRVEVEINAKRAWHSRTADWIRGRGVSAYYYSGEGGTATLFADAVRYEMKGRRLEAWGNVQVDSDGTKLETTRLQYDSLRGKISTREFVKITRGANVMTGQGLEADPNLGNLRLDEVYIKAQNPEEVKPLIESMEAP